MNLQNSGPGSSVFSTTGLLDYRIADLVIEEPGRFRVHSDVYVRPEGLHSARCKDGEIR